MKGKNSEFEQEEEEEEQQQQQFESAISPFSRRFVTEKNG